MLVILIVFMITVPAVIGSAPIKVNLPETMNAVMSEPSEDLPLHISLKLEEGKVVMYLGDKRTNEADLRSVISGGYADRKEKPSIYLAADRSINYGEVVKAFDMLASLGLHKIPLDTKHVSP